jgi:hypothetical protein
VLSASFDAPTAWEVCRVISVESFGEVGSRLSLSARDGTGRLRMERLNYVDAEVSYS